MIEQRCEFLSRTPGTAADQFLGTVAQLAQVHEPEHPAGTLDRVELALYLDGRASVLRGSIDKQRDPLEALSCLLPKQRNQIGVVSRHVDVASPQILVQLRALTSMPSVPDTDPSTSCTAAAMVKQVSPVSSDS